MRRAPVATLAAILVSLGGAPAARAAEAVMSTSKTYVLVHGAWGGAWAFRRVDTLLTAAGHHVVRPTLTGLGERVHLMRADVGLDTHVDDVVNVLRYEDLTDVVLVGHSYGGMVISGVAERVPDRIRHLVYLDAFVPEDGESVATLPFDRANRARGVERMKKGHVLVPPWLAVEPPVPGDVPHPAKTFTDRLALKSEAARRLPATYVLTVDPGATGDTFAPYADRAKTRGWTIVRMEADHTPQISAPEALVTVLASVR
jgi:pimeloyl-ACP methyl ester carboxylesterase